MSWDKISFKKFLQIDDLNKDATLDDYDKLLFTACIVNDLLPEQLDKMEPKKAIRLCNKIGVIFTSNFTPIAKKRVGIYKIDYDPFHYTLGQYIELHHYLTTNPTQNGHLVMASISTRMLSKHSSKYHKERSAFFNNQPVAIVLGGLKKALDAFEKFNKKYEWLFGVGTENAAQVDNDPFNRRWGWMFSARVIAQDLGIKLDQAFNLPVVEAFNSLAYLKAKAIHDEKLLKRN